MNITKLLYNNTDEIITSIAEEPRYKADIEAIEGNNDFNFIFEAIRKWICRKIHNTLTEDFHYKN